MSNVVTAQVQFINAPVTNGNFTFQTAIVLVEPGQYQSYVELSFSGNNMQTLIGQIVPGGVYDFHVNIRGSKNMMPSTKNPGNNTAFNSIGVWKIETAQGTQPQPPQQQQHTQQFQQQPQQNFQQQGGTVGQPQQGGFAAPQQQGGFANQPQQNQGGFANNNPSAPAQNFGNPQQGGFGSPTPQQGANQGFGNTNGGGFGNNA